MNAVLNGFGNPHGGRAMGDTRSTMSVATRPLSYLPEGTALSRYLMAKALGRGDAFRAKMIAERWRDTPQVHQCLDDELQRKAAVAAGTTSDATWAGPLAVHGIAREALTLIRGASFSARSKTNSGACRFARRCSRETGTAPAARGWAKG